MHAIQLHVEPDPDEPEFASVFLDVRVAGRPYRLLLDTGAARSQLPADEFTASLREVGTDSSAGAFGADVAADVVVIPDLVLAGLVVHDLEVTRSRGGPGLLGMDVLSRYRCWFRLAAGALELNDGVGVGGEHDLILGRRGHPYVQLTWPGASGVACWDTGASVTVVDDGFWRSRPGLFEQAGTSSGTDSGGGHASTPLLRMAGPRIGQRQFAEQPAVAVDLAAVNRTVDLPMDLILGYPAISQADWFFDFPSRRWSVTSPRERSS
jgi:gag-polyprotein putative aspartyl protease